MADLLKYMYNPAFFEQLCPVLKESIPGFKENKFIHAVFDAQWADLELKQRTRQVTVALRMFLPDSFPSAAEIVVTISNRLRETQREQGYPLIFLPDYIAVYGLDEFDASMKALEQVTKLVSAEFAIRPFLIQYPNETMKQMLTWSKHKHASVRRLASEGCRPRLPWGIGIPALKKDASSIWPILENLKEDPSEYVRRSVANNLNDIAKEHPEIVLKKIRKWKANHPSTQWILKHGCRTLLKNGSEEALLMHGFDPAIKSELKGVRVQATVKVGGQLQFEFTLRNTGKKEDRFRLEYVIYYITSSGKTSRKVFKIGEYTLKAGVVIEVNKKQSFKDLTTRKHFKGKHQLSVLVNGKVKATEKFLVIG